MSEPVPVPLRGEIRLKNDTVAALPQYCVTRGIPLPPGRVTVPEQVSFRDEQGKYLPSAGRVLQLRQDGSIEWLLADFLVDLDPEAERRVFIELGSQPRVAVRGPVDLTQDKTSLTITNGLSTLILSKTGGSLIKTLTLNRKLIVAEQDRMDLETLDQGGKIYRASLAGPFKIAVEDCSELRATVRVEGRHQARDGSTFLEFTLRFTLAAGCPDLKVMHTFHCREKHPGQIQVRAVRLVLPTRMPPEARKLVHQKNHGEDYAPRAVEIAENLEVVASSVDNPDLYRSEFKPFQGGALFVRNFSSLRENLGEYPYHMRPDFKSGFRPSPGKLRHVYPYLGWVSRELSLVFAMERWVMQHPKSVVIDESVMTISLIPEWAAPVTVVQGVSKSHSFWLTAESKALDIRAVERHALRWEVTGLDPVAISFDPAWPRACQVLELPALLQYQPQKYPFLENLIEPFPAAGNPDRFTYYRLPATGMFNFGDFGGEGGFTNNEDDLQVHWPLLDYLRSGRVYCFDCGQDTARHYLEVDFCEYSTNPRLNGGLYAHTQHHFEGMCYPSHQWSTGILTYYYLTGDERAKQVVIRLGEHLVWWTENLMETIALDGREAGVPLSNLVNAWKLTSDKKYLKAARKILDAFHLKYYKQHGRLFYPYPQWGHRADGAHHRNIEGYGDWASYHGMYHVWQATNDPDLKVALVEMLSSALQPSAFAVNDARTMDFYSVWIYLQLTGDDSIIERLREVIPMLLRRGGHPLRRLHFLQELDRRGLIDERLVGSRGGVI